MGRNVLNVGQYKSSISPIKTSGNRVHDSHTESYYNVFKLNRRVPSPWAWEADQ